MSLTILSRKLDQLNEREKLLKMTYDVRGTNKHQHRYIKDLKDDFKEDLQLRFGNKPYGLGWNQESENGSEKDEDNDNNEEEMEEIIDDDDEKEIQEEPVDMISPQTALSNFRPTSGKTTVFPVHERPFSASTGRPMTASSAGKGAGGMPQFLFSQRPISAITKMNHRNFQSNTQQDISESTLLMSMKGPYQSIPQEEQMKLQGSKVNNMSAAQIKANESIFWKNTRKFDNNTRSVKQFNTKQLLFNSTYSDPRMINSSDLGYLKEDNNLYSTLEKSKLVAPKNHHFHDVVREKKSKRKDKGDGSYNAEQDSQLDAKNSFNQSLSYIQGLRSDFKVSSQSILNDFSSVDNKKQKPQRPLTAHPLMSSLSPSAGQKKPLEIVAEQVPESNKIYFSSLSDMRKKAFFLRLHSMEQEKLEHPGLSKELKTVDWTGFKEISNRPDFQSIHLMLIDLNTFDHGKFELEFQDNGSLKAKDKEGTRNISEVHKDFLESTRSNIISFMIYFETTTNRLIEVFFRVIVYEEKENEYDLLIWRNIYRFLLHKMILANSPLYPEFKTYPDLAKMIRDIIDDKKDHVSPIASQIQLTKDHPLVVERNSYVYNFDFHSYILECSSHYAQAINGTAQKPPTETSARKNSQPVENLKQRPASAMAPKTKFPMFGTKQSQNVLRKESKNVVDPIMFISAQSSQNALSQPTLSSARREGTDRPSLAAAYSSEQLIKLDPPRHNSDRKISSSQSLRNLKKPQEKVEMIMQGGRMDIYPDIRAASNVGRSAMNLRENSDLMLKTFGGSEYGKFFSASSYQTPNSENLFQRNPNGITVQYTKSPMKKMSNVVVKKRPHSGTKTPIRAYNSAVASPAATALNSSRGENPYRFKF